MPALSQAVDVVGQYGRPVTLLSMLHPLDDEHRTSTRRIGTMSARKTMSDRGILTVWPKTVAKLQAIGAESPEPIAWQDMANDILDVYLTKYRSKKPLQLPDERFSDRPNGGAEWESVCL